MRSDDGKVSFSMEASAAPAVQMAEEAYVVQAKADIGILGCVVYTERLDPASTLRNSYAMVVPRIEPGVPEVTAEYYAGWLYFRVDAIYKAKKGEQDIYGHLKYSRPASCRRRRPTASCTPAATAPAWRR